MATLVKTGIGDGQTLTPVIITELYDAFTGDKLFDNITINNTMKVTHDGKVSISHPSVAKVTPYALNVVGTVRGDVGRFDELIYSFDRLYKPGDWTSPDISMLILLADFKST